MDTDTLTEMDNDKGVERPLGTVAKGLYITGGTLALGLAFLGIFLPGLPVTPFALLAGWMYARSSDKLYHWLLGNKYLGSKVRNYREKGGVTRRGKVSVLLLMGGMVLFSALVVLPPSAIRYLVLGLGGVGALVVWFWVPTVEK